MTAPTGPPPASQTAAPQAAVPRAAAPGAVASGAGFSATPLPADDVRVVVDLHAESLAVSVVDRPRRRVLVRREIVTEEVSVVVAVRREVLRIEEEDLPDDAPDAVAGPADGGRAAPRSFELVLHEERPVVGVEVVPVERVRISTVRREAVGVVRGSVRREELDVDVTPAGDARPTDGGRADPGRGNLRS